MEVSVVSFNIDCLSINRPSEFSWENRKNNVIHFFTQDNSEVYCLQEACNDNIDLLHEIRPDLKCYCGISVNNTEGIDIYNPVFWTDSFKMLKSGSFRLAELSKEGEAIWDSSELRTVTWVLLLDIRDYSRVIIINTHLDNKGVIARKKSADIINEFANIVSGKEYCPVILCGDFNSRAWFPEDENQAEYGDMILAGHLPTDNCYDLFIDAGFIDCFSEFYEIDELDSNTYHDYYGDLFPKVRLRIDWQLLKEKEKNNVKICAYYLFKDVILSDHYPVICTYQIESTTADCLYSGYNKAFLYCSQGNALRIISNYLEEKYPNCIDVIKKRVIKENYLRFTKTNCTEGYDYPSGNAIYQNGVVKEIEINGKAYIFKGENYSKQEKRYNEIRNYLELMKRFPGKHYLGELQAKELFFEIETPVNINTMVSDKYLLMHKEECKTLEELLYSFDDIEYEMLEMYVRMINYLLEHGFVCADMSPRNVLVEENEKEIVFRLIDFEKSYFLSPPEIKRNRNKILRGQLCGEELAVLIDMNTIIKLFKGEYNPDSWNIEDTEIIEKPFRPEVHDVLVGRGLCEYSMGLYNKVEREILNAVAPQFEVKYEELRFPGRLKFKISHYIDCLSVGSGREYERIITEILINAKREGSIYFNKTILALSEMIGSLEEQILIDYSFQESFEKSKDMARKVMKTLDEFLYVGVNN